MTGAGGAHGDFFAAPVQQHQQPTWPLGAPGGPDGALAGPPAPAKGSGLRWGVVGLLGAAVVSVTVLSAVLTQGPADVAVLTAVTEPAPAAVGWSAAYVDEQGRPARWDPCVPIRYVVNPRWMPVQGRRDLTEALRRITVVSGLRFQDEGDTDELPVQARAVHQPDRYGDRWAPLLVAWVPGSATDIGIGGGVQGLAQPVAVASSDGGHIVSGSVTLDAGNPLPPGFGPGATDGEVLLHELAHAVGLGHVDDATQVMHTSTTNSESTFGRGDRAGLTALGVSAGCHPAPEARALRLR